MTIHDSMTNTPLAFLLGFPGPTWFHSSSGKSMRIPPKYGKIIATYGISIGFLQDGEMSLETSRRCGSSDSADYHDALDATPAAPAGDGRGFGGLGARLGQLVSRWKGTTAIGFSIFAVHCCTVFIEIYHNIYIYIILIMYIYIYYTYIY